MKSPLDKYIFSHNAPRGGKKKPNVVEGAEEQIPKRQKVISGTDGIKTRKRSDSERFREVLGRMGDSTNAFTKFIATSPNDVLEKTFSDAFSYDVRLSSGLYCIDVLLLQKINRVVPHIARSQFIEAAFSELFSYDLYRRKFVQKAQDIILDIKTGTFPAMSIDAVISSLPLLGQDCSEDIHLAGILSAYEEEFKKEKRFTLSALRQPRPRSQYSL